MGRRKRNNEVLYRRVPVGVLDFVELLEQTAPLSVWLRWAQELSTDPERLRVWQEKVKALHGRLRELGDAGE